MSHRRKHRYNEYEYGYHSDYKHRRKRNPVLRTVDIILFLLVIPLPIAALLLWLLEVSVPLLALGFYTAITQTVAGLLFLILTARGVGGFGKVGYFFTHTRGKRWMTTDEAKGNTYLFGGIMLIIGVLIGLWCFNSI